jgi:soluble lytic murein transglycosylase
VLRNLEGDAEVGFLQHLAREMDYEQLYRLQIQALNRFATKQPENITAETLRLLYPKPFFDTMDRHTERVMDTSLLLGLARQESSFDPYAVSGANARGLLQILPTTARGLTKKRKQADLHDYAQNIELGALYVTRLAARFGGSFEKALAAYNAGQGNVAKWERRLAMVREMQLWMDLIPFRETRDYVPSILRNAYWYHRLFPSFSKQWSEAKLTSQVLKSQVALLRTLDAPVLDNATSAQSGRAISSPTNK